jgi:Uma2 family endonuclease
MVTTIPMRPRMMAHARDQVIGRDKPMHMALQKHRWTRADLTRMPNDGNRYEVIGGELFVTPAPRPAHWAVVNELKRLLERYCERERLRLTPGENQAFVSGDSEAIPDIAVREMSIPLPDRWDDAPLPVLLVEVSSESTRRSDEMTKRVFYVEAGVPEYWIVDSERRSVRVITTTGDHIEMKVLRWSPAGASEPFALDLPSFFRKTLGS